MVVQLPPVEAVAAAVVCEGSRAALEAVFTKGERDWYVLLHQRVSTTKLIYVSRILVIVKLFTDVYINATT